MKSVAQVRLVLATRSHIGRMQMHAHGHKDTKSKGNRRKVCRMCSMQSQTRNGWAREASLVILAALAGPAAVQPSNQEAHSPWCMGFAMGH